MTKQYVPLFKNLSRSVTVETDATIGATVGTNLFWPDGTVVTEAELRSLTGSTSEFTLNIAYKIFVPQTRTLLGVDSVDGGGDLSANRTFSLVNDEANPLPESYYGTDSSGAKGWNLVPYSFGHIAVLSDTTVSATMPADTVTFIAGSGMSITTDSLTNEVTFDSLGGGGTVSSVGLSLPTSVFDVSGSPVTGSGTLTATFDNQSANTMFAGPTTGGAATPAFRALVAADIPSGGGSPLTTKGDLYGYSTVNARLAVGTADGERLAVNSGSTLGLRYERAPIDPRYESFFYDDFISCPPSSTTHSTGTDVKWIMVSMPSGMSVTSVSSTNTADGVWQMATGTSTTGNLYFMSGSADTVWIGGGPRIMRWRVKVPTLGDGTNTIVVSVGLVNTAFTDGLFFRYVHNEASGCWRLGSGAASTFTYLDSAVTVVANTWYSLEAVINSAGTSVEFFVNNVSQGTKTTNLPTVAMRHWAFLARVVGTANRQLDIDNMYFYKRFDSSQ